MVRLRARRIWLALLPLALLMAACGRLGDPTTGSGGLTGGPTTASGIEIPELDSPMLASPTLIPWGGGDPTWHIPREDLDRVLNADARNAIDRGSYPGLPEDCYSEAPDAATDRERCLFPALRDLGVSEEAIQFYVEQGLVVLGTLGSGPVKVADMWWGPAGAQDTFTPVQILVPGGFMAASPGEWAPFATALQEAYASDTYRMIASIPGISDGYPLRFSVIPRAQISAPTATDVGWVVSVSAAGRQHGIRHRVLRPIQPHVL